MSQLVLIRHGQASFFEDDYDRLSPDGRQQSRRLGEYWLQEQQQFDAVYCGPRERHRDTAAIIGEEFQRAGITWPDPIVRDELDEHQVDQLVRDHAEALAEKSDLLADYFSQFQAASLPDDRQRSFQRLFEAVASTWLGGDSFSVESWTDFRSRVNRLLSEVIDFPARKRRVAMFSSVGPISVAVQRAVQCEDHIALQTGWRIWNCSLTEFVFSPGRITLDRFNALPHLPQKEWTYR